MGEAVLDLRGEVNELVEGIESTSEIRGVGSAVAFDSRFKAKAEQHELGFEVETSGDSDLSEEHLSVVSNTLCLC